jgi:hypothetical protein
MLKKRALWMADWFDAQGHRRRKGFTSQREAESFQSKMRKEAGVGKKIPASRRSASSQRLGPRTSGSRRPAASRRSSRKPRAK